MAIFSGLGALFRGLWGFLDGFRRFIHLILMLLVFIALAAVLIPGGPAVPSRAALVIEPTGALVEQMSGDAVSRALDELAGNAAPQTLVRDLVDSLAAARDDVRIGAVVLDLGLMAGGSISKLQAVAAAIRDFQSADKKVLAYGDFYTQAQYYLAAHADEVFLHPSGAVFLQGYGRYRMYYREALEKLSVDWNVFKVGEYKSFVEPYIRDDMSEEDRSSSLVWLSKLWQEYRDDVGAARGLEPGAIMAYSDGFADLMRDAAGDVAVPARDSQLVDDLILRDAFRNRVIELVGTDKRTHSYASVSHRQYLQSVRVSAGPGAGDPSVGIIVAAGDILDGSHPPGTIGGDSTAGLISKARLDDNIRAVVLRIDSGGGSKFASEIIQRELQLLRESGKPLIASMAGVAASGGYWIAMPADQIWAHPSTITGSIGIGGYFPTVQRSLSRLGITVDGVGTTPWSGEFRPDRAMGEPAKDVLQLSVEHGYRQFISEVAAVRNMTVDQVDEIARGRVWIGTDAYRLGLVDSLGDLDDAVKAAASLAGLAEGAYAIEYVEPEMGLRDSLTVFLSGRAEAWLGKSSRVRTVGPVASFVARLRDDLERLARFNDPHSLYLFCLCEAD